MSPRLLVLLAAVGTLGASTLPTVAWADPAPKGAHAAEAAKKKRPAKGKAGKVTGAPKVLLVSTPAPKPEPAAPIPPLKLDLHRATLANGLRVVIDVDHGAPDVAIAVVYDVGSRDEEVGRSGFAHLFEHMMFQGSRNVARGDHFKLVSGRGGDLNGTTNEDRTSYFEVLPEGELALGLWLEADRMRSLDVSQPNFENQRKVVQEEYRMRVSNVAYGLARLRREELVYEGFWPYAHATIGSMADLDAAQLDWVQAFHAAHYGPNTAVLSIAGDVDPERALSLAKKYFEDIPKVSAPTFAPSDLPAQSGERRVRVDDAFARSPGIFLGWAVPPDGAPDHAALEVCADILGGGQSSRLHQILVKDRGVAQSVTASTDRRRGPDVLELDALLATGGKLADVERAIDSEIDAIAARGPTEAEVATSRRRVAALRLLELQSNLARARRLGEAELFHGDAALLAAAPTAYQAVTREDVKRVAAQYLTKVRRTIVEVEPPASATPAGVHAAIEPSPPAPAAVATGATSAATAHGKAKKPKDAKKTKSKKAKKS